MTAKALINVGPGGVMESGLASARHPESVPFWHDGENVAFRNLGIEKAIGAEPLLGIGRKVQRIAQAYLPGTQTKRIYFQCDDFSIFGWDGNFPFYIGNPGLLADLVPFGTWLFVCANGLFCWQGSGEMAGISGPTGTNLGVLFKHHAFFATDSALVWPDVKRPLDFTTGRDRTANRLRFRDIGSEILAVRLLADGIGVYTKDALRLVGYRGSGLWFAESREPINGIGAIGPNSIIEAGFKNYGLTRNGIFVTDGASFQYIDTPAFHGYLETDLDWTKPKQVFGWHNEAFQEVVWTYPAVDGTQKSLAYKYTNGGFTKYRIPIYAAVPRDVFDYPILGTLNGLAYAKGRTTSTCFARTKPLDAGDSLRFKFWDHCRLVGNFSESAVLRLGVHNQVNEDPEWIYSGPMVSATHLLRESVFLTMELSTDEEGTFDISQIMVTGQPTGRIF